MKEKRYGTLEGLEMPILVYESYEEADKAAGREGAALEQANDNLAYRGALAEGRRIVCDLLEEETGIKRRVVRVDKKKDGSEVNIYEPEGAYAKFVCAEKGWENLKHLQPKVDEAVRNLVETIDGKDQTYALAVDITERQRTGKAAVLPKRYKEVATQVFDKGAQDKAVARIQQDLPTKGVAFTGDRDKDIEILGWAIRDHALWKEAQAAQDYLG
jgi:hypothetical protein